MSSPLLPLNRLLIVFAGWANRRQLDVIEYLQEENRVLRERLGGRRIRFTDAPNVDASLERRKHSADRR
jgi:hypothetical protein